RDAHPRGHQSALARLQADGLGRHEIGTRVTRVGITGQLRGDNGDIDAIAHPTRLMQNPAPETRPLYRERLSPSLWLLASAAVVAPMVSLTFVPVGAVFALV